MSQITSFAGGGGGGDITDILGTANQITVANGGGPVTTLSIPDDFIAPGSISATTNLSVLGGEFSFRGAHVGYTASEWITTQATVQTVDATPTDIAFLPFPSTIPPIAPPGEQVATLKGYINGFRSTFNDAIGAEILVTAYRPTGGNVTIVGFPVINSNPTNPGLTVSAVVDVGSQQLRIQVTGIAAQTYNWVGTFMFMYLHNET